MPLESVIADLLDQARSRAEELRREAAEFRERAMAEARERAAQEAGEYAARLRREAEALRSRASRDAEIEFRRARNAMMKRLMEESYSYVRKGLAERRARVRYMPAFAAKAGREFGGGTIHVFRGDADLVPKGAAVVVEDLPQQGGLMAESEDGSVVLDLTVDTLLADFWRENLASVHRELFG